ncbi:MAG TPA: PAS domain-containing protein, partial [Myxococcales bacterium]
MAELDAQILEGLTDPVVAADAQDRIVFANPAAYRLFAWPAGELPGQPLDALLPERARGQHPGFFRNLQTRGKGPVRAEVVRKDGAELDAELSLGTAGDLLVVSLRRAHDDA